MQSATALYPFVPSGKDFPEALKFHAELGFKIEWQAGGAAGLRCGDAYFILQDIDAPRWAEMQMLVLVVDNLDQWWAEFSAKNTVERFPGTKANPPKDFPWGREVNLSDPAGVLWKIRQKAA
jgi:uncharacterized glyoxalase superfamily protein PhnB